MAVYKCPVCNKVLTKREFETTLGIIEKKEKHLKHLEDEARIDRDNLRKQLKDLPKRLENAKAETREREKRRVDRLMKGQKQTINRLQDRIRQLERGSTPQTEGLEFEETLVSRLKKEFPSDEIQHKGKSGDVLHFVRLEKRKAGVIIYECKRTPRISSSHIEQAFQAKQSREADFAVLVTTGNRKGFSGLTQSRGVLVVAPLGVIPLVSLLRVHLIEILKAKVTKGQRLKIAEQLMDYITSPQFKNPIEEIMKLTSNLQLMILEEFTDHKKMWEKRWEYYQRIYWDTGQVQGNLQLVLEGKPPKPLVPQRKEPLLLPPPSPRIAKRVR